MKEEQQQTIFELKGIHKSFGAVRALRNVDLTVRRGEVHALIGENGAGKSTLMKILSGAHAADGGEIFLDGKPYKVDSPIAARHQGVAMIYQELNLAPHLTVAENLALGVEEHRFGFVRDPREKMREVLETLGNGEVDLDLPIRKLSIGTRQIVEIARALLGSARLIIMDEPTSSLSATDAEFLFEVVRKLADSGIAVIYISHFLEEIHRLADCYTVLRDGESVGTGAMNEVNQHDIVRLMVGREIEEMFPKIPHEIGETILEVENLSGAPLPEDVSLKLHRGEILGIAGLVGSGRSETIRSLFGLQSAHAAQFRKNGREIPLAGFTPAKALRHKFDFLSENRKEEGLATERSICLNTCLSSLGKLASKFGFLNKQALRHNATEHCKQLQLKYDDIDDPASSLSGGNQQKVALARILLHDSEILLLDEPTRGIDVGSKAEICRLVGELAAQGKAIIVVGSYLPELLGICDNLAVMHRGRLSPTLKTTDWSEESIMLYATSGTFVQSATRGQQS